MYTLAGSDFFYCVFGCLTVCLGCLYIAEGKESIGFISYTILTWLFLAPVNTFQLIWNTQDAFLFILLSQRNCVELELFVH